MSLTILGDADIFAFKYTSSTQKSWTFDEEEGPIVEASFEDAIDGVQSYIEQLKKDLGATEVIICLSDPNANFRKDVWSGYKANRKDAVKPVYLQAVKDWFSTKYKTYQRPKLEADDCMGILATHPTLVKGPKVVVSEDKDLQGVPGLLFNPRKDDEPRSIGKLQADLYHLWQTIVGDATDGYPGASGIGPASKEAQGVLASKSVEEAWGYVVEAFKRERGKHPLNTTIARATLQARLARILRATDWDFKTKAPRLWCPPRSAP